MSLNTIVTDVDLLSEVIWGGHQESVQGCSGTADDHRRAGGCPPDPGLKLRKNSIYRAKNGFTVICGIIVSPDSSEP